MSTHIRKLAGLASKAILAIGLLALSGIPVHADTNPGNDAAAMVVRIRPNADRGVTIATGTGGFLDLGFVNLNTSTQTVYPATVTIAGNMIDTELNLSASISGGWVFDSDDLVTSTGGANQLNAFLQFTAISTGLAPTQGYEYFRVGTTSSTKITANGPNFGPTAVGISGSNGAGRFESDATGADMDMMAAATVRHMYTWFTLPAATSITADQYVNFILAVRAGP